MLSNAPERLDKVERIALDLGFVPLRNKHDERCGIGVPMPSITALVSDLLADEQLYRILSGVAHADVVALSRLCFVTVEDTGPAGVVKVPVADSKLQTLLLARTTVAYARAAWEVILRFGGDAAEAAVSLERCFDALDLKNDDEVRFWRITPKTATTI